MKRFITSGAVLLGLALVLTIAVWLGLQSVYITSDTPQTESVAEIIPAETAGEVASGDDSRVTVEPVPEVTPEAVETPSTADASYRSVPLRDLPLTDGQKAMIEFAGIEVETFVITPAMQACAAETLPSGRVEELVAGDAPTFSEATKLFSCL